MESQDNDQLAVTRFLCHEYSQCTLYEALLGSVLKRGSVQDVQRDYALLEERYQSTVKRLQNSGQEKLLLESDVEKLKDELSLSYVYLAFSCSGSCYFRKPLSF